MQKKIHSCCILFLKNVILALPLLLSHAAQAEANFQIWPIYPRIESDNNATAVWLKNVGKADVMVQIRVFKWEQQNGDDQYTEQTEIIPSPPVVRIKQGDNNMLRLSRAMPTPDGQEVAYRIIVDELPVALDKQGNIPQSRVNFQMRYSIPLFAYGKGLGSGLDEQSTKANAKNEFAKPILTWSVDKDSAGKPVLVLKNSGAKFARLSNLSFGEKHSTLSHNGKPFTAYVLAQSSKKLSINEYLAKQLQNQPVLYGKDASGAKSITLTIPYAP